MQQLNVKTETIKAKESIPYDYFQIEEDEIVQETDLLWTIDKGFLAAGSIPKLFNWSNYPVGEDVKRFYCVIRRG